jgi:hypothetical protein
LAGLPLSSVLWTITIPGIDQRASFVVIAAATLDRELSGLIDPVRPASLRPTLKLKLTCDSGERHEIGQVTAINS